MSITRKEIRRPFLINFDIEVWKIMKDLKKETDKDFKEIIQEAVIQYAKSRGGAS